MSIKDFHKLFIFASILLCAFFGYWAWGRYNTHNAPGLLATSVVSFVLAAALVVYGIYFIKKAKTL